MNTPDDPDFERRKKVVDGLFKVVHCLGSDNKNLTYSAYVCFMKLGVTLLKQLGLTKFNTLVKEIKGLKSV